MYDHDFDDCSMDGYRDAAFQWRLTRKVGRARAIFCRYHIRAFNRQHYIRAYGVRRARRKGE
jgi:hypothetical protein